VRGAGAAERKEKRWPQSALKRKATKVETRDQIVGHPNVATDHADVAAGLAAPEMEDVRASDPRRAGRRV